VSLARPPHSWTAPVSDKGGVGYETAASMTGIEQLDLLDSGHSVVLARAT
jgi:hypothetical protein